MGKEIDSLDFKKEGLSVGPNSISTELINLSGSNFRVIKKTGTVGSNLYKKEARGARMLSHYLPVIQPLFVGQLFDPDVAIYPLVKAKTLHEVLTIKGVEAWPIYEQYLKMHINLWRKTFNGNYDYPRSGYGNKIRQTQDGLITFLSKYPYFQFDTPLTIQVNDEETQIPSVLTSLDWLDKTIQQALKHGVSLTHGDENLSNCLVRKNNQLAMIDLGDAGYRSPFESVAKISSWLSTIKLQNTTYLYRTVGVMQPLYKTKDYLEPDVSNLEARAQEYIQEQTLFLLLSEIKFNEYLAAFRMMYLLREGLFYCHKRKRNDACNSLINRALALSAPYL